MFDIGWSELLIIATVAIIVVGPKDLPRMLRTAGQYVGKLKRMAGEFRSQFDDAMRDSELQELRSSISDLGNSNPLKDIEGSLEEIDELDEFDEFNRKAQPPQSDDSAKDESTKDESTKDGAILPPTEPEKEMKRSDEAIETAGVETLPHKPAAKAEQESNVLATAPPERTAAGEKSGA